jgi:excisionase family DNA binding protein
MPVTDTAPGRRRTPPLPPPAYTVEEAARLLAVHVQTIRAAIARGDLPGFKVGRQWRVSAEALNRRLRAEARP